MAFAPDYKFYFTGTESAKLCTNSFSRRKSLSHFLQKFVSAHPPGWLQGDFYSAFLSCFGLS